MIDNTVEKIDLDTRLNEAEVYSSMGLLSESVSIYEQILSYIPEPDADIKETVREKITLIKKKIGDEEDEETAPPSSEELSIIKKTLTNPEMTSEIMDSASAFKELGLFKEALAEYEKLLDSDYPFNEVIPLLAECLLNMHSPSIVIEKMEGMAGKQDFEELKKAQVNFILGQEMEKRGHKDLALDLYKSAGEMAPDDAEIRKKVDSLLVSISSGSRYDYLVNEKMVTTEQLQKALALSKKMRKSVEIILIEQFNVRKEVVGKSLSLFYNCPLLIYNAETTTPVELLNNLKKTFLIQDAWVPIKWEKNGVHILVDDPSDLGKIDRIGATFGNSKITFYVGIREDIEAFIKLFFDGISGQTAEGMNGASADFDLIPDISFEEEEDLEDQLESLDEGSSQVVKLVDQVLVTAYRKDASDIHVEPSTVTKTSIIRFRMDGVCQEYIQVPISMAKGIISRIKIMANLDIAERRLPQDGKIKFKRRGIMPFELRVATIPTAGGYEDAVLRILAKAGAMPLDKMGLSDRNLEVMKELITKPYGLILAVGPTGSGKTTTLHSALGRINKPGVKIWTAEDPVEITQGGLRQVEARPKIGLDFARIMRSFLRADPDVIMIGEMRDNETASIGIEASLTGHLVFSTLHTNSAPETVTRLLDMGLNPLNFSDAFLGVLAQRLVRVLCPDCREEYHPSEEEFEELATDYGKEQFETLGIEFNSDLTLYRTKGCDVCSGTGYKGRMGVHELMEGTSSIKGLIKKQGTTEDILKQAAKDGMTTLKQDGITKVFQGLTDINEVRRVCIA